MEIEQDWDNSRLADYLRFDYWETDSALRLLAGFSYTASSSFSAQDTLDVTAFFAHDDHTIDYCISIMKEKFGRLKDLWDHTKHSEDVVLGQCPPSYYINWAVSKDIKPEWLHWAVERKLYISKQESERTTQPEFDKLSPTYPTELDFALQAWHAVSVMDSRKKPKARIHEWLNKHAPSLSDVAKERIATVANWDKQGGATRTSK